MIDRQQLAEALGRLEPRDREILDYSLRRRVPDEDLGEIFDGSPADVARLRAAAVEKLSDDLGVQRGADLGHMLKELLEPAAWELFASASAEASTGSEDRVGHRPVGADGVPAVRQSEASAAQPDAGSEADPESEDGARRGAGSRRRVLAGLAVALVLLVPVGVVAALGGTEPPPTGAPDSDSGTRPFVPERDAIGDPFPTDPKSAFQYPVAHIDRPAVLYGKPGGDAKIRIAPKTDWDSPRVLSVVKREGSWLAVLAPELENGEVGWIRDTDVKRLSSVSWSVHVDLSKRRLVVRRNGKDVRAMKTGVGRADYPTPVGRYAITDKLRVTDEGSPYGCCVLALTGHQTKLPVGWPGGDRLAVHATQDTSGLGQAVSLGCMRTDPKDAAWMLDTLPLGAPVFVRG